MNKTKKCPYCGETIKADAEKCRYCREWLSVALNVELSQKARKAKPASNQSAQEVGRGNSDISSNREIPDQPKKKWSIWLVFERITGVFFRILSIAFFSLFIIKIIMRCSR